MNILHLCDVMASSGYLNIERGPGRHGISNAFFLYIRDPDGRRLELYTSDYFTGDHDHAPMRWSLNDPRRQTLWGSPTPRSWSSRDRPFPSRPCVSHSLPRTSQSPIGAVDLTFTPVMSTNSHGKCQTHRTRILYC
jgi:Glyoxalase/Bleomycin resistance protein/Dioxygenase superfamily